MIAQDDRGRNIMTVSIYLMVFYLAEDNFAKDSLYNKTIAQITLIKYAINIYRVQKSYEY